MLRWPIRGYGMTSRYLTEEEGAFLLRLARQTLRQALEPRTAEPEPQTAEPRTAGADVEAAGDTSSGRLFSPGAAFVTLHTRGGELRGCIGSLIASRPLVEDVRANTLAAAFEDPRFAAVTASELPNLVIDVSVLTEPESLEYDDGDQLLEKLRPGIDGVVIESDWRRATFLPQVWEQLPHPEDFLAHLCYKAGLSGRAWREGELKVSTYQAQKFQERV